MQQAISDGRFACIRLTHHCVKKNVLLISRLRLDSALYEFSVTPEKIQRGRRRQKGNLSSSLKQLSSDASQPWQEIEINWYGGEKKKVRILSGINLWYSPGEKPLPVRWVLVSDPESNKAEAFFSTDLRLAPVQTIHWFILRWNIEVTFEETRAHLGIETQRQWSPKAIARITLSLMALFSLTCLFALEMLKSQSMPISSTAWYDKKGDATFSDIIAFIRRSIWAEKYFCVSYTNGGGGASFCTTQQSRIGSHYAARADTAKSPRTSQNNGRHWVLCPRDQTILEALGRMVGQISRSLGC